jgi:prepilin-type processing-associated H-X9-DG protein
VVAFLASTAALLAGVGLVVLYARRRPVGTPLTWGEAMVGAMFIFGMMFLAYGIVPHQFLSWADGGLKWRSDAIGIPLGPFGKHPNSPFKLFGNKANVLFGDGITFNGRGKIIVTKETVRDIIAATIYIVFLGGQIAVWSFWQKRGTKAAAKAKASLDATSTYGRPLVKKA